MMTNAYAKMDVWYDKKRKISVLESLKVALVDDRMLFKMVR